MHPNLAFSVILLMLSCRFDILPSRHAMTIGTKHGSDYMEDPHLYHSIVGALQYGTLTRPEVG